MFTIICRQPSARDHPWTANTFNDGHPLSKLSWNFSCCEKYVERLDARSLDLQYACGLHKVECVICKRIIEARSTWNAKLE